MNFASSKSESRQEIKQSILTPVKTIQKSEPRTEGRELLRPLRRQKRRSHSNQLTEELLNTTHRFDGRSISIPTNARLRILNKLEKSQKILQESMISELVAEDFQVTKPDIKIRQSILKPIDRPAKPQNFIEQDSDNEQPHFDSFLQKRKIHKPKLRFDVRLQELKPARMIERNIDQSDD